MKQESVNGKRKVIIYTLSVTVGFIATFIFMLIFAAIYALSDMSEAFAAPAATVCSSAGGLVASFLASKKIGFGGLQNGAICGGVTFLIILAIALIVSKGGLTLNTLFNFVTIMIASLIGGIWGVGTGRKLY